MNKEKQIEEMAYEMTHYKGKMCERIERNDCLLKFHTFAFVDCNFCKLAEHLYEQGYRKQSEGEWGFDGMSWTCSECGEYATKGVKTTFCPNCGAKMRKEDEGK